MGIRTTFAAVAFMGATAGMLGVPVDARANIIPVGTVVVGGQGFGAFPRLLTLQDNVTESGAVTVAANGTQTCTGDCAGGNNIPTNQNGARTISALGWTAPNDVSIGFNASQEGAFPGLTITDLTMTVYGANNLPIPGATFSLAGPVVISDADVRLQQGNGNALFQFILDAAQQAQFNTLLLLANSSSFLVALSSSIIGSNDGPDSFLGIPGTAVISPVPIPPAILLFGTALAGMGFLSRRRRTKNGAVQAV